jgi:two-component system phosphate regulon sensor histidine kinase PhoR
MFGKSLLWRLYPAYLLITVAALLTITWYLSQLLPEFYHNQVADDLQARARLIEGQILKESDFQAIDGLSKKLGTSSSTRITVILPNGVVVADSDHDPATMENHGNRPEVKEALEKGVGRSLRFSSTLNKTMMYLAVPIEEQGRTLAVVRTSIPAVAMDKNLKDIYNKIILSVAIIAIFAAGVTFVIARTISRPIERMKEAAQRFASGRFESGMPIPKQTELAGLAQSLNEMAMQLQDRIDTITRQRNELEAILSSMIEGVLAVDVRGHVVSINKAAAEFLGSDPAKAQGRTIEEVIRNTDFQEFVHDVLNEEHPSQTDITLSGQEDRIVRLDGASLRDSKGDKSGAVIVISDMTRVRRLEDVRRDFVANVSHELRTPITSIKGFVETLLEGAYQKPQEAERFLKIIAKHSDRLGAIVEDLLTLSSLEDGTEKRKITLEKASIRAVLGSVAEMSSIKADEKHIAVELDCDGQIEAKINTVLLEQALLNLVDNAIKYSEPGSLVRITARKVDKMIAISVHDNGCGIAKIHQDRIFERFYVIDKSRSRKLGGTGLGLAIVKHIAEVHGGHVTLESSPGAGSTFTIHLPAG